MDELKSALRIAHANTFVMAFKTQGYHWNIEGVHFSQYHDFFAELYEDLYSANDPLAEHLRKLGEYAPKSLSELYSASSLSENTYLVGDNLKDMLNSLVIDNNAVIDSLNKVFSLASSVNEQGLADYIAGRLDAHKKYNWMTVASMKGL